MGAVAWLAMGERVLHRGRSPARTRGSRCSRWSRNRRRGLAGHHVWGALVPIAGQLQLDELEGLALLLHRLLQPCDLLQPHRVPALQLVLVLGGDLLHLLEMAPLHLLAVL